MKDKHRIGNIYLNLGFYQGDDLYTDGEIEQEMLNFVRDIEFDETLVVKNDNRWPILYHFSPERRNLLEWYNFSENDTVLEIGAGCGALTGLLSEKTKKVTAIELSKMRAEIIAHRYKEKGNIEVIVGNLNDIKLEEKFSIVTLIGVLEYASKFTDSAQPFQDFLSKIKSFLKKDGVLILAIENKFGLKYWAGAREDHTGLYFDGIENYRYNNGIRTFSKHELSSLLLESGFTQQEFYYPMPDYKMPVNVYSNDFLPSSGESCSISPNYDTSRVYLYSEKLVFDNLIQNNMFDFFANSYLVISKM